MKRQRVRTLVQLVIASAVSLAMLAAFFAVGGLGSSRSVLAQTGPGNSGFVKPGWGCGDTVNHSHTGPPGLMMKSSRVSGFTATNPCSRSASGSASVRGSASASSAAPLAAPAVATSSSSATPHHKAKTHKAKTHKAKTHKGKAKTHKAKTHKGHR